MIRRRTSWRPLGLLIAMAIAVGAASPAYAGSNGATLSVPIDPAGAPAGVGQAQPAGAPADPRVQVASDRSGATAAVWVERTGRVEQILSASRAAGGAWGAPAQLARQRIGTGARALALVPVKLVVSAGQPSVLWGAFRRSDGVPRRLEVATRMPAGSWSRHTIVRATRTRRVGLHADLAATSDGTLLVAWSRATREPSIVDRKVPAGRLMLTERRVGGWQRARSIAPAHGVTAAPTLAVNGTGGAAITWAGPAWNEFGEGAGAGWALRTPSGWRVGAQRTSSSFAPTDGLVPRLDDAGRLHLLGLGVGFYGRNGVAESVVQLGQPAPKPSVGPSPSPAQSLGGWLGTGYWRATDTAIDAGGTLVTVWAGEPLDVERGSYGTGALWADARTTDGAWRLEQPDQLTQTSGALDVGTSLDGAGQVVATWATAVSGPDGSCGSLIYRAVRSVTGTWSPRAPVATAGAGQRPSDRSLWTGPCDAVAARETGGPAPMLWWIESSGARRLIVTPVPVASATTLSLEAQPLASTWAQVRRDGGLRIRCGVAAAGWCSASLTEALAELQAQIREQSDAGSAPTSAAAREIDRPLRSLRCLSIRATGAVEPAGGRDVVMVPLIPGCLRGLLPATMTFTAVVVADAPGAAPVTQRVTVTLQR